MFGISERKWSSFVIILFALSTLAFAQFAMAQQATPVPNQVELTGLIDAINGSDITVAQQVVDVSQAEVKFTLEVGLGVKVEGTLATNGHIVARQVKLADVTLNIGDESEIVGILTSFEGTTMVIGGQTIDVSQAEIYPGVAIDETVEAKVRLSDGILVAREVQLTAFSGDRSPIVLPADCVPTQPAGWTTYTIQTGDSLSSIARGSNISVRQLAFVNCITNPGAIVAGTSLFVPTTPIFTDDHGQDDVGHDAGDDHGQDGPGHDVGDDHGQDDVGHDVGDDHGQDGSGHDDGDDNGGNDGNSGHD